MNRLSLISRCLRVSYSFCLVIYLISPPLMHQQELPHAIIGFPVFPSDLTPCCFLFFFSSSCYKAPYLFLKCLPMVVSASVSCVVQGNEPMQAKKESQSRQQLLKATTVSRENGKQPEQTNSYFLLQTDIEYTYNFKVSTLKTTVLMCGLSDYENKHKP